MTVIAATYTELTEVVLHTLKLTAGCEQVNSIFIERVRVLPGSVNWDVGRIIPTITDEQACSNALGTINELRKRFTLKL